jgi:DNA repair protein RecO (recombination protein O)
MEWTEPGLILGVRKHGESSVIVELMTRAHGRHAGVVRSGRSRTMQPVLQPGNEVLATWRARLEEHIGAFALEPLALRTHLLIGDPRALHGVNWLAALLRLLAERDPHPRLYDMAAALLAHLDDSRAPDFFVRFELALLAELGFGLDLERCAATGATRELIYVSPKTGRAVSREAGAPWADRLLPLPAFLREGPDVQASPADLRAALRLTGFFLDRNIFQPRGQKPPDSRAAYMAGL